MKSLFAFNEKNRRNRERSLCLESLEDRMLLAVTAGGETAAAVLAADADPMATAAVKLDTPENIQGVSSANSRITLSWDAVTGASGYTVNYRQVGASDWKTKDVTTVNATITGVLYTKAYEYKVMAKGNGSSYTDSDFSETVKFVANPKYSTVVETLDDAAFSTSPSKITLRQAVYFASMTDGTVTFADGLEGTIDLAANGQIGTKEILGGFTIDGDNRITVTNSATNGRARLFYAYASDTAAFNKTITFKNITLDTADSTAYKGDTYFDQGEGNGNGAAIMVFCGYDSGSTLNVTIENVTVTNCSTTKGTVYVYGAAETVLNNCTFTNNTGSTGGALFIEQSDFVIAQSEFSNNVVSYRAGALFLAASSGTIDDSVFSGNRAESTSGDASLRGGAIVMEGAHYSGSHQILYCEKVTMNNTQLVDNYVGPVEGYVDVSSAKGGALCLFNVEFTANECTFSGNQAANPWGGAYGGAVYAVSKDWTGQYESEGNNYGAPITFNKTLFRENSAGSLIAIPGAGGFRFYGGAICTYAQTILNNSLVADNTLYSSASASGGAEGSALFAVNAGSLEIYNSTIAGNKTISYNGTGLIDGSAAIRDQGNSFYYCSVISGNKVVNMNGTEDESDDTVTDLDYYTNALEENFQTLPRFFSCVLNPNAVKYGDYGRSDWHYGIIYGTYYDDAAYTQVSKVQTRDGGPYLRDDNVYQTDYASIFADYAAKDYTLASGSVAVDAVNMDVWKNEYEFDLRGEGYYRLVNEIADMGAYELQQSKPTFEVTVNGWTGAYDGQPHTVTIDGLVAGDTVYYSADGITYGADVISYTEVGEYTIYVKVERAGYEDFYGSGDVVIQGSSQKLDAPVISTGKPGVYVSYGANRHQITWGAVANASGYELAYNAGDTWKTMTVTGTSAVVTGLAYESDVQYKVRALGTGSYTDSDYSAVKTFTVCPMDINNDGDIAGADRTLLGNAWLAEEGDENYLPCCDIDGNEEVSGTDRSFLVKNWLCEVGEDELAYPKPLNVGDAAIAEFVSEFDIDLDVF